MGAEQSQLQQNHQVQMARAKLRHACANVDTNWQTAAAQIQLIMQCCANFIVADIPPDVCILGVKVEATSAFALAVTQSDTIMVPHNLIKHHLVLSTDDGVQSPTALGAN